ncbi:MAG: hypothetical protein QM479_07790 [Pseudomonadota bacterium]
MISISNDKQLRSYFDSLDLLQQRSLALIFINNISYLNSDERIEKIISEIPFFANNNEEERLNIYQKIKTIMIKSYTNCGSETDWKQQAEHFVAAAVVACLTPEQFISKGKSIVWKTAIQARMAKNCEMIEKDSAEVDSEAIKQYHLAEEFSGSAD